MACGAWLTCEPHSYWDNVGGETFEAAVARGEIKYLEDRKLGLEHAGEAIVDVQTGRNKGKSVIVVAQE